MLAVLIDAIRALRPVQQATPHIKVYRAWLRERAWLQAEDHSSPFSFINICDALGLDAGYIRRRVLRPSAQPLKPTRRYAYKVKESWIRQGRQQHERWEQGIASADAERKSVALQVAASSRLPRASLLQPARRR